MKVKYIVLTALLGLIVGAGLGWLGTSVTFYNEEKFGVSYPSYHFEWLALPSLPGLIICQFTHNHDWQIGETWIHRASIIAWNSIVYGTFGFALGLMIKLRARFRER